MNRLKWRNGYIRKGISPPEWVRRDKFNPLLPKAFDAVIGRYNCTVYSIGKSNGWRVLHNKKVVGSGSAPTFIDAIDACEYLIEGLER